MADPYRWLEDESSDETQAWSTAQDELYRRYRAGLPTDGPLSTEALTARLRELLGAGFVSPPAWRGDRRFFSRRSGDQEHAVVVVARGRRRARPAGPDADRPRGHDDAGLVAAVQGGPPGGLPGLTGGTEESVLRVLDVATGEVVDGPIDRARYSPVAWLPGGEAFYYVRRLAPDALPADEAQYHRRVWLHRLGTPPTRTSRCSATGSTTPTTTASRCRATAAG